MSNIESSAWAEAAASNNTATPNGWPEFQPAATVNDCAREMMGAIKRWYNRSSPTVTAGGTADALTLTYGTAPPSYVAGMEFAFYAGAASNAAASPTINVNALGAKTIYRLNGSSALGIGEVVANSLHKLAYDGTNMRLITSQFPTTGTVTGSTIFPNGKIFKWGTGTYTAGVGTLSYAGVGVGNFPTATRSVMVSLLASGTPHGSFPPAADPTSYATTGFTVYGGTAQNGGFIWWAWGD